jgi:hypothetical protein
MTVAVTVMRGWLSPVETSRVGNCRHGDRRPQPRIELTALAVGWAALLIGVGRADTIFRHAFYGAFPIGNSG